MSHNLLETIPARVAALDERMSSFDWSNRDLYARWLTQTYFFVSHTSRLICLAAGSFSLEDQRYHQFMCGHLKEESGHEKMALDDLKALGLEERNLTELVSTRVFHEHMKHLILTRSPYCIFGRIFLLEGLAITLGEKILPTLTRSFGESATEFLRLHTEEDKHHYARSLNILKKMTAEQHAHIEDGLESSFELYQLLIKDWDQPGSTVISLPKVA